MPGNSFVDVQPYTLDVFCLGELNLVYVDWGENSNLDPLFRESNSDSSAI
jgi:hypothetical protein